MLILILPLTVSIAFAAEIDKSFLEGDQRVRQRLTALQGSYSLPEMTLTNWMNSDKMTWADLKGKVVVLDFWATWCGPCIRSIPHSNKIYQKYKEDLVFIGVSNLNGGDKLTQVVNDEGIMYPVAIDKGKQWMNHFRVNGFPDYYIINADGQIWGADVRNGALEQALQSLLGR